jgi:hypothetical protein
VSSQLHAPAALYPGERAPGTQWRGGWVDPRAGLDDVEKRKFLTLPGLELQPLGRPAHSQSVYWLFYPGSLWQSGNYLGEVLFRPQWGHWLCWLKFLLISLAHSSKVWDSILITPQQLPYVFQFIIHEQSYHSVLYGLGTDSIIQYATK